MAWLELCEHFLKLKGYLDCIFRRAITVVVSCQVIMDAYSCMQDSHGTERSGPAIPVAVNEETTHLALTPSHAYSSVEQPRSKPADAYENTHPLPLSGQSSPFELDGEMVEHKHVQSKEDGVVYADPSVHYMTVMERPTPKDMVRINSFLVSLCKDLQRPCLP